MRHVHFAEVEGHFVAYEEFNTMFTPRTEIVHASHVFLRIHKSIPSEFVVASTEYRLISKVYRSL